MIPKLVIFDWDGTLVDSVDHIADSLHKAAMDIGFSARSPEAYRDIIGLGLVEALEKLYPGITAKEMADLRLAYADHFFARPTQSQDVFEGIFGVLDDLEAQDRLCAVATGKSRRGLDMAIQHTGLGRYFGITRCADETQSKPDPQMLHEILDYYQMDASEAVMVGDTAYDLEMAQRAGVAGVGVTWGVHQSTRLAEYSPQAIVHTVADLRRALALDS